MDSLLFLLLLLQPAPPVSTPGVKRICIEPFKGDETLSAASVDAVTTGLLTNKNVRVTENCSKADWKLKGSIVERSDLRSRSESEETGVSAASFSANTVSAAGSAVGGRSKEALSSTETVRSVTLSVKLLNADGEVTFASTQDSKGSKSRSPVGEAAEKAARDLLRELFPAGAAPATVRVGERADGYQKIK